MLFRSETEMKENPPTEPQFNKLIRTILSDEPRVTKFKIIWETSFTDKVDQNAIVDESNRSVNTQNEVDNKIVTTN